jgi:RNA polymerase sigma factor (sigma-70 family)
LIEACRRGDRLAQRRFYDRHAPWMLGICRRYLTGVAEAEDAMIRSMHRALTRLGDLREGHSLRAWLRRIAVNECLMDLRSRRLMVPGEEVPESSMTGPDAIDQMAEKDLLSLLEKLAPGYRTIFNLYVLEGYNHREIGELLGISLHTSKSQLAQARKRLAALLGKTFTAEHEG